MKRYSVTVLAALFACLLGLCLSTSTLSAQNGMSAQGADKGEMAEKMANMSSQLQLNPEQKKQMRPIIMEEAMQLKDVKGNTSLPPMQKAMKMHQIADAADAKVKPILNPDQYQKYEQMRAQEREQMMQKMKNK